MRQVKSFLLTALLLSLILSCASGTSGLQSLTRYVDPMIGTDYNGHTFPGATLPFGMVSASPDTGLKDWKHCSGYHYSDSTILGFSQTHMSGTGASDMCDILLMPLSRGPVFSPGDSERPGEGYRSRFSHDEETARPGYYRVRLTDSGIDCEATATDRCSFYRFSYAPDALTGLVFDMEHGNDDGVIACGVELADDRTVRGFRRSKGFIRDHVQYFTAEFDRPVLSSQEGPGGPSKLYVDFGKGGELKVRMGLSTVSCQEAAANLSREIPAWDFEAVCAEADRRWNGALSAIQADFPTLQEKTVFYTALYHSMVVPNLLSDRNGGYRGWDGREHVSETGAMYTNYSLWDTYRAVHPLLNIVNPERNVAFINSMLERYRQIGFLPINEYGANETYCMIGYHAVPVIADAILQGLEGFDQDLAYEAMVSIARDDARGVGYYRTLGYIPTELEGNSVSKVLEYCYDDWCIAMVAEKLGHKEDAGYFRRRSLNYRNVFDTSSGGFMRGRHADGSWRAPFSPFVTSGLAGAQDHDDYTEGNAWQYTFYVPHDMTRYVEMNGGDEAFSEKLDVMFSTELDLEDNPVQDVTGLVGQYAHGNEPSHHTAYLYNFAGKPWKTQQMVSTIRERMYSEAPDGLCGNDDCGQMSAWYIFSAMGFYPVTPGSGCMVIGSPSASRISIPLGQGREFTIQAHGVSRENIYIQSVRLNGKPYDKSFFTVQDIMDGALIEYEMGPEPNKEWGRALSNRPVALAE